MDIVEKIRTLLNEQNKTQIELATFLEESQSTLNKWISKNDKNRRDIPNTVLLKISNFLKVSPYELLNIEEEYEKNPQTDIILIEKLDSLAGAGSLGDFIDISNENQKIAIDKKLLANGLNPKYLRVIEVIGESMEPVYREGEYVILDMTYGRDNFVKIAGTYIVRVGDIVYIKDVEFLPNNKVKLKSLNPKFDDIYPHREGYDYEILGKVCGKIKFEKGLIFD